MSVQMNLLVIKISQVCIQLHIMCDFNLRTDLTFSCRSKYVPFERRQTSKTLGIRAYGSGQQMEGDPKVIRAMYDDTSRLLEKDGETLKWGEVYHMFKKSKFFIEAEELDELKVFKNIRKSGIFRVASHPVMFPCTDSITWILKNIDVNGRYICNARKDPIASFKPEYLEKCYHIEKGSKKLDIKAP
jgi:hypothetical protein